jgi:3-phosphoshikimate 1-carboxyvinyltransferase
VASVSDSEPRDVAVPGDKSLSHRALMLAALARGSSYITGILDSADVRATAECLRRLGVSVPPIAAEMTITGAGTAGLKNPERDLDCANSGTSTRLLAGIVAGAGRTARFVGDESLSRRPMRRVAEPLERMGARVEFEGTDGLPMRVVGGKLHSIDFASPSSSAQIKSAVLLAGFASRVSVTVNEPIRSRDHTERMMSALGVPVEFGDAGVVLSPMDRDISGFEFEVPGDPSSVAFFAAWSALCGVPISSNMISVNPTRTGFLTALANAGAKVETDGLASRCGEPVGRVFVSGRVSRPFVITGDSVPAMVDELPLIGCIAACIPGESRVTGARELRVKESDRIATVVNNLRAVGAEADELPDGFVVRGGTRPLEGCVQCHGDHRIAMAFGVLGALAGNRIEVDDRDCVGVSFPDFWTELRRISRL